MVIVPVLTLGAIAYTSAYNAVYSDISQNLGNQVSDMKDESATVYNLTQNKVNDDLNILRNSFYSKGTPEINDGKLILSSGSSRYVVNDNFEIVDGVQKLVGGAATIFQKEGDKAVRISTNVIGDDGKRAIGTTVSQAVYDAVINKGETYYGSAIVVGKPYITAYEPIKNAKGEIVGILFVGVEENATVGVLKSQIKAKKIGEKGYMYVLNSTGYTILHPTNEGKSDTDLPFIKEIITKKNGFIHYNYNGVEKVAAYAYYQPLDWIIIANGSLADFMGPIDAIRNTIILVIILGVIAGVAISYWFGNSISRRMTELVRVSEQITKGNLSVSVNESASMDEIGILNRSFLEVIRTFERFRDEVQTISFATAEGNLNVRGDSSKFQGDYALIIGGVNKTVDAMAIPIKEAMRLSGEYAKGDFSARVDQSLQLKGEFLTFRDALNTIGTDISEAITKVKQEVDGLSEAMGHVGANVNSVTSGMVEAHHSIEDVSKGTGQVAQIASAVNTMADHCGNSTKQIMNAMQDLATTVSEVATKMNDVTSLTGSASQLSERGKEVAGKAEAGMQGIMHSSSDIERMVTDINNQMSEIGRIVDIISSIAEQTNLLALNAAIEAARAGEAGLGFAVVAGEVKDLATGSQKSAENIASIITALQQKTALIADAVKVSLTEVKNGDEAVGESLAIFSDIVGSISEIDKNMNEVAAASQEQAASVEEVTATVHEFGDMIQKTAKESVGLAAASEESSAAVDQIVTMIDHVNTSMDEIRSVVSKALESTQFIEEEMSKFRI
ncbi:methyl-accepting chemotaxis protein [Methanospirillum lacunae]|uniref:methyl-accepting chemotaxis protein n=1 Tax=Methanospirillum lacunae TaxID=668570 RepID=UPI001FE3A5A7|nr:Cache 3/Cache 2 fusion domain-containing protein [Methanospirillum lacunae]